MNAARTPERRKYDREYARRRRAEKLAAKNASASTCQAKLGRFGVCAAVLETVTDGNGRTALRCPMCERKARGICRDCGLPVAGQVRKAIRCTYHTKAAKDAAWRRCRDRDPEAHRRSSRRNYQRNDERRRRKNEYKKAWRKANPEKVRAYKLAEMQRPNAKRLEYHRKRRERDREQLRARERARARGIVEMRTCVTPGCDIVVTHRKKKCTKCRERERVQGLALLAPTKGRGRRTDLHPAERVA